MDKKMNGGCYLEILPFGSMKIFWGWGVMLFNCSFMNPSFLLFFSILDTFLKMQDCFYAFIVLEIFQDKQTPH